MLSTETKNKLYGAEEAETSGPEKNPTWEKNHVLITKAMDRLIYDNELWPTKTEIAEACGLSRATVYKHLAEMEMTDVMGEALGELKFMAPKIVATLFEQVKERDVKAMRLAFELMGALKKGKNVAAAGK